METRDEGLGSPAQAVAIPTRSDRQGQYRVLRQGHQGPAVRQRGPGHSDHPTVRPPGGGCPDGKLTQQQRDRRASSDLVGTQRVRGRRQRLPHPGQRQSGADYHRAGLQIGRPPSVAPPGLVVSTAREIPWWHTGERPAPSSPNRRWSSAGRTAHPDHPTHRPRLYQRQEDPCPTSVT